MPYTIKDWPKFQHFKYRSPPWIKCYQKLLDDPEWHKLDGESAKYLFMMWLVASEQESRDGTLPCNSKLAFRLRITENRLESILSKLTHWLTSGRCQDDDTMTSSGHQSVTSERETERETEREGEGPYKPSKVKHRIPDTWHANELHKKWWEEKGITNPLEIIHSFIDDAKAKGKTFEDWNRAFYTWMRNAIRFGEAKIGTRRQKDKDIPKPIVQHPRSKETAAMVAKTVAKMKGIPGA